MYCKKCGKFIGSDTNICDECKQKEAPSYGTATYQAPNPYANANFYQPPFIQQDTSVINLGKGIAAAILSTIGFIFAYAALTVIWEPIAAIVCILLSLAPTILGLVFGCNSISNFKETSYIKSGKRIPVLILGIASVIYSATSLLFAFIIMISAGSM